MPKPVSVSSTSWWLPNYNAYNAAVKPMRGADKKGCGFVNKTLCRLGFAQKQREISAGEVDRSIG